MPRAIDRMVGPPGAAHIDAYQEYSNLVGRLDGGTPLSEVAYESIRRRAADTSRRLYVYYRNSITGLDCKAIGPQTLCFCQHRYNEHEWDAFESRQVRCKMPGCTCTCFNYVPVRGAQDLQCSACHTSFRQHYPNHSCPKGGKKFCSSYNCSCGGSYDEHSTVFESRAERERAGRQVDAGWMEQAAREGLPVCHLGGVTGFSSLADGVDRMLAGLESDEVTQSVASRGGVVGDAGANRFLERCMLEDTVQTAALVHGKAAGMQALAQARAKRRPSAPSCSSSRASGAITSGSAGQRALSANSSALVPKAKASSRSSENTKNQNATVPPKANVHTLNGPTSLGLAANPKSSPAPRRAASSLPPGGGSAAGGRKLGGARHYDAESMRDARLARLDKAGS